MNNVGLYGFCLEQGFCKSKANKVLHSLQDANTILVTDIVTGTPARKGSFYLAESSARITIGLRKR
jgi:mannose/fructose-specific phosphotransferase system component IIA